MLTGFTCHFLSSCLAFHLLHSKIRRRREYRPSVATNMYTVGNTCYATVNVVEKLGIDSPSNENCLIMNYIIIIDTAAHMAMPLEDNSCYAGTLRLQSSLRGIK